MPERVVISNTSPLLYLHQIGHLDLLRRLYGTIQIPQAVSLELGAGAQQGLDVPDTGALEWLEVQTVRETSSLPVVIDLGAGEAEAIALAVAHSGSLLILDDGLGRRIAQLNKITYTGTLGVLIKAKRQGLLSNLAQVVEALRKTTMYLTPSLIEAVLRLADEA